MTRHPSATESTGAGIESLRRHGRSFYWAGQLLSGHHFSKAAALYGICRDIDDLADNAVTTEQKSGASQKLALLEAALRDGRSPREDADRILERSVSLFPEEPIALTALTDMVRTIRTDLQPVALQSYTELLQYAYGAAGTVGVMMACVLGAEQKKKALRHAVDLGIGMQLTNIARDVLEDAHLERIYLPARGAAGSLVPEAITNGDRTARHRAWQGIREVLLRAENYYQSGWNGLRYLPLRPRFSIAVAAKIYQQIGRQILDRGEDQYWHRRSVVSWNQKLWVSLNTSARLLVENHHNQQPGHQTALHHGLRTCLGDPL